MSSRRKGETREDYLAREREVARAKYQAKREAAGLPYEERRPLTDEERAEHKREYMRSYWRAHPEKAAVKSRKRWPRYYAAHRTERSEYQKQRRAEHPDLVATVQIRSAVKHGRRVYGPPKPPLYGPPLPPLYRLPIQGPPVPPAIRYQLTVEQQRLRYWSGKHGELDDLGRGIIRLRNELASIGYPLHGRPPSRTLGM